MANTEKTSSRVTMGYSALMSALLLCALAFKAIDVGVMKGAEDLLFLVGAVPLAAIVTVLLTVAGRKLSGDAADGFFTAAVLLVVSPISVYRFFVLCDEKQMLAICLMLLAARCTQSHGIFRYFSLLLTAAGTLLSGLLGIACLPAVLIPILKPENRNQLKKSDKRLAAVTLAAAVAGCVAWYFMKRFNDINRPMDRQLVVLLIYAVLFSSALSVLLLAGRTDKKMVSVFARFGVFTREHMLSTGAVMILFVLLMNVALDFGGAMKGAMMLINGG